MNQPEDPSSSKSDHLPSNFVKDRVLQDLADNKHGSRLATRFPPHPNGYLHLGHAKSICLNFAIAELAPQGTCNLRFDDTNPVAEDVAFVEAIQKDVRWLGFDWHERLYFASGYFEQLHEFALKLIRDGKAYVDSQTLEELRKSRGNYYTKGVASPHRDRSVEDNLGLFERMRRGEFEDGTHVLRAKIDMESPNLNLRDPPLYRIRRVPHHRTGTTWCVYPMYDFAHGLCDALEGITHSICTLEFENHRPLYEWFLEQLELKARPQQIEFAKLTVSYIVLGKRKLLQMVTDGHVSGWDDPRMPTLAGMRRRGYTPEAVRAFCTRVGVAKRDSLVDIALLEHTLREDLNARALRVMVVLKPLKVVIANYPEGHTDTFDAVNHPEYPELGTRQIPFSKTLYIERDDFIEAAPKKWFRLAPGREVRLRYACLITCQEVIRDPESDEVIELRCTWDPESRGGTPADGRKVKGTLHWVSAPHALKAEARLYDRLFLNEDPSSDEDFLESLNPNSLETLEGCMAEPSLKSAAPGVPYQFERLGYFCADGKDASAEHLVFNRTISLRDTWGKISKKG